MDGPQHYREAEKWARQAEEAWQRDNTPYEAVVATAALAQVHATLALAAAGADEIPEWSSTTARRAAWAAVGAISGGSDD